MFSPALAADGGSSGWSRGWPGGDGSAWADGCGGSARRIPVRLCVRPEVVHLTTGGSLSKLSTGVESGG